MRCSECGAKNPPKACFCRQCDERLSVPKVQLWLVLSLLVVATNTVLLSVVYPQVTHHKLAGEVLQEAFQIAKQIWDKEARDRTLKEIAVAQARAGFSKQALKFARERIDHLQKSVASSWI